MGVAIYVSFLQKNGGSFRSRTHYHERAIAIRSPIYLLGYGDAYHSPVKINPPSTRQRPTYPEIRNDAAARVLGSVSAISTCVVIDGLYFFFPTNLSQIRRVINLRRARLPRPARLAINVAFIGTPVKPVVALFGPILILRTGDNLLDSLKNWLFEFIILPYISSLIKIK